MMSQDVKEKIEVLSNFFEKPINIFLAFISLTVVLNSTAKYLYSYWYAIKCQEFYKIPAKYFQQINKETIYGDLLSMGIALALIIILALTSMKMEERTDSTSKIVFYAINIILAVITIVIIYDNLMNIVLEMLNRHMYIEFVSSHISAIPTVFLLVAAVLGGILIASSILRRHSPKLKWVRTTVLLIAIGLISFSAFYSLPIAPKDKSQYEVTFINNKTGDGNSLGDSKVILSEIDGNFLTVSYALDKESDAVIFYTQSYKIQSMEDSELWVTRFNSGVKVDSKVIID